MTFLAKNSSYIHESGRTSILELLGAIITKFQQNLIVEYADLLFVALVMVVANDESPKCREMAAQLIKSLWVRLKEEQQIVLLSHLHTWSGQTAQPVLEAAAKRKIQRNVIKRESRKRKERVFTEGKGRNKRARQE
ncbi:hypothetical protein BJ165DRAFT_1117430 [Panaeolus papilionaceus]|nr:hypothetical protein BJ165DRAFT_1117430 [Panaeolus papilionaceus]